MIQLYEYQKRYLADLPARAIMAADTGTGKTYMALAQYERYVKYTGGWNNAKALLILAPASKVRTGDWEREIKDYFGDQNINYEIYSYEKFSRYPKLWDAYLNHAIICDEVHKAKNPQSNTGKAVFKIGRDAQFFIGLSATPLPNGWIDIANYFKIFKIVRNITEFKKRYCNYQTFKGWPELISYNHEDEMARHWQGMSKLLTKAEANELPSRTFIGVNFKKPKEYNRVLKERTDKDGNFLDSAPALAHALRQELTAPKLPYLKDLLEGTSENVVIFYNYISEREAILKMLEAKEFKAKTVFRQDGDAHELPKKQDWSSVRNSVTIAHYKSGSTGVEMTYATQVVYFSPTYSYAEYIQSIGRVYRNGQTAKTTFYNFRTTPTIEVAIYDTLRGKNDFQAKQWVSELEEGGY